MEKILIVQPDGNKYKKCIAWRAFPGCAERCFDICEIRCKGQANACKAQFEADREKTEYLKMREND